MIVQKTNYRKLNVDLIHFQIHIKHWVKLNKIDECDFFKILFFSILFLKHCSLLYFLKNLKLLCRMLDYVTDIIYLYICMYIYISTVLLRIAIILTRVRRTPLVLEGRTDIPLWNGLGKKPLRYLNRFNLLMLGTHNFGSRVEMKKK